MSTKRFNTIEVLESTHQVRVGAGATWGAIVAELDKKGMTPAGTVTSSHATAGGTLSADCLSRFSPRYGKEASHVVAFLLLTVDGRLLSCTPPARRCSARHLDRRTGSVHGRDWRLRVSRSCG